MTMKKILKLMTVMGLVMVCACLRIAAQGTPVEGTVEATGKLVKVMAVGTETTGWAIQFEDEVSFGGNGVHSIEVDGDTKKFGKLENKKVTVKGMIVHRSGVESKDRMVFVVQKIKEWKAPAADRPSSY
jgi:autotransporter adhesin